MLTFFEKIIKSFAYQTDLEAYIRDRNPKNAADVERLLHEFTYKQMREWP